MKVRLENYYKQVSQFDYLDKTSTNSFINTNICLTNLVESSINLDRSSLKKILINESIFNKNLELNYLKLKKSSPIILTLRRNNLFRFLDFAFNCIFDTNCSINIKRLKCTIKHQSLLLSNISYNHFNLPFSVKLLLIVNLPTVPKLHKQSLQNFFYFV